jgi:hypothetical protein
MRDGELPWDDPGDPDLFLRAAALRHEMPRLLAEVRERVRRCRDLCRWARELRLELQGRRRGLGDTSAPP